MAEEEIKQKIEKKVEEVKEKKIAAAKEEKKVESKKETEEKKEEKKKVEEKKIVKKEDAVAKGNGLHASKKHCMYICSFIKGKDIDKAIKDLEDVIKFKRAVPFKGEIPHRKGKIMSGRYPIKASKMFINMLKALKGNSIVNGLELDKTRIYIASASWAARPLRKGNVQGKRTNVLLKAKEFNVKREEKK